MTTFTSPIEQHIPLARGPWKTFEPFLFCVHHQDQYPSGDDHLAPTTGVRGRQIGSDFSNLNGWSMYHGDSVPGFPQHPHRGFETISIVRRGLIDHSDSLGATARIGAGDVQWMTAGAGIVHAEMFPLVHADKENPTDFFQLWLNLPSTRKMTPPAFKMFWSEEVPRVRLKDSAGRESVVTVIAGAFGDQVPPTPPEASWAAEPYAEVAIWIVELSANASVTLPDQPEGTKRVVYHVDGGEIKIGRESLHAEHGALMHVGVQHELTSQSGSATALVLQARPIGEPVAQHGPFVMNNHQELRQAFYDYQRTRFGGWPWRRPDPVHDREAGRFARYADGREDHPPVKSRAEGHQSTSTQRGK